MLEGRHVRHTVSRSPVDQPEEPVLRRGAAHTRRRHQVRRPGEDQRRGVLHHRGLDPCRRRQDGRPQGQPADHQAHRQGRAVPAEIGAPMHAHSMESWRHEHVFLGAAHDRNERRTWLVVGLTAAMMVAEIAGGTIFGSMALLADGWHMSTHAGALAISAFAYRFARRHARDPRFAFGTGKLGDLAGFASAVLLALIALLIGYESLMRVFQPVPIHYAE